MAEAVCWAMSGWGAFIIQTPAMFEELMIELASLEKVGARCSRCCNFPDPAFVSLCIVQGAH